MKIQLRTFALVLFLFCYSGLIAQPPADYYTPANGKKREVLKSTLKTIIANPNVVSYAALWDKFKVTDRRADGKVWDIYSNATNYVFGTNQCGNYAGEGNCYNREHSFPKSWFSDATPMYSDLYHLYPSDGYVNGKRSNFPFGEVANPTYTSKNGYNKLGPCSFPDCSGTVFEPNDEFKGDLARTYFYMATCYENLIGNWGGGMTDGSTYPAYKTWAVNLLLKWHRQDPVNEKEINRNNEVYKIQNNRNPFIDYPDLVEFIWGTRQNEAFNSSATASPVIIAPLNNSEINLGSVLFNTTSTKLFSLKGTNITSDINLTISGSNASVFALNRSKWTANEVMAGAFPEITYSPSQVGQSNAILTIAGEGLANVTVQLTGLGSDGFMAKEATGLTPTSFVANWTASPTASSYQLEVFNAAKTDAPIQIIQNITATSQLVENLTTRTGYRYLVKTIENGAVKQTSSSINVTTPTDGKEPVVTITLPEGDILLETTTGTASQMLPIQITGENLTSQIIASVPAMYEIKTASSAWSSTLNLQPGGELVYIRITAAAVPGTYADVLTVMNDEAGLSDLDIQAIVESQYTGESEVLASWTFPSTTNPNVIPAECGIKSGTTIYLNGSYGSGNWIPGTSILGHAGDAPATSVCGVTEQSYSLSLVNKGTHDKKAVIRLSTQKYGDIRMTYHVNRSNTGFTDHVWSYSTDGTNYTPVDSKISVSTTFSHQTLDFSKIPALNNQDNIYLMLTVAGATNTGNNRLDNIVVTGIKQIETSVDNSKADQIQVFAANGELIVRGMTDKGRLQLFDISGRIISENTLWVGETIIPLPQKGIFIAKIATEKMTKSVKVHAN